MQPIQTSSVPQTDSLTTLQVAIHNRQVVQFKTDTGWRTIEPHRIGYVTSDPLLMLVYGYSRDIVVNQETPSRWQVFRLTDMHRLSLTTYSFEPHHDYQDPTNLPDSLLGQLVWLNQDVSKPSPPRAVSR